MSCRLACRYNPDPTITFGKNDSQQSALDHARDDKPRFTIAQVGIRPLNGKTVIEHAACPRGATSPSQAATFGPAASQIMFE